MKGDVAEIAVEIVARVPESTGRIEDVVADDEREVVGIAVLGADI
jgi:hypothetical protein